jgi:hypothetical protein
MWLIGCNFPSGLVMGFSSGLVLAALKKGKDCRAGYGAVGIYLR